MKLVFSASEAASLARVWKVESERKKWLRDFERHLTTGSLCYVKAMEEFDQRASEALTQSLADVIAKGVLAS